MAMDSMYSTGESANGFHARVAFPNQKGTYYDLKNLQERHKEILRRLVLGQSKKRIADELGITYTMIQYTERSMLAMDYIDVIRNGREESTMSVQEQIDELAPHALNVIRDTITDKMKMTITDNGEEKEINLPVPLKLRVDASKDILSRAGYVPPTKISGSINHNHNILESINRAKEIVQREKIKEAEFEELPERKVG